MNENQVSILDHKSIVKNVTDTTLSVTISPSWHDLVFKNKIKPDTGTRSVN